MRTRLLAAGLSGLLSTAINAQPSATIFGQVLPCNGNSYPITITSLPGMQPPVNFSTQTGGDCYFALTSSQTTYSGGFVIQYSCDGGITQQFDTVYYNAVFPVYTDTMYVQLQCGGVVDCLGAPGGPNLPGAACDDNDPLTPFSYWNPMCVCDPDTGVFLDCLGVTNGPALPGTPCDDLDPNTVNDLWDGNCGCNGTSTQTCSAGFWVMQAFGLIDPSTPVPYPYQLWVWNLSQGTDPMSYSWSFGDGTGSTDPYPTHTYSGNGPYLMCLTIADATGCTSTTCDSISIDNDGILNGMVINDEANGNAERVNGFTINVHDGLTTSVAEVPALSELHAWPNPASGELNLSFNARQNGAATVTILDVNGREVAQLNRALSVGRNQQRLDLGALPAGVYTVRIADRSSGSITTLRFVTSR